MKFPQVPKPKNDNATKFLVAVVAGFVGMIIALSWNNILVSFIDIISAKVPLVGVFGGLVTAVVVTFLGVSFGVWFLNHLNQEEEK